MARREREEVRAACDRLSLPIVGREPAEVLLEEILRTRRTVYWLETEQAVADQAGDVELSDRRGGQLLEERKHLARVSAEAIRTNVARRALELMEDEARRAVAVLEAFALALGLDRRDPKVLAAGDVALKVLPGGG